MSFQVWKLDEDDAKSLNQIIEKCVSQPRFGLLFVKVNLNTVNLPVFSMQGLPQFRIFQFNSVQSLP